MPAMSLEASRRHLRAGGVTDEEAHQACIGASKEDFEDCVFDVVATNDAEMAHTYLDAGEY